MARKNNTRSTFLGDVLPKERLAKSSQEMLIEGAASMSGQIVKNMAKDLRDGGMQKTKKDKKDKKDKKPRVKVGPPKPKTRSYKLSDKKAEIKVGKPVAVGVIKKSTNKMKKESAFKMKGPGQKSPAKAIGGGKYMEGFKKMTTKQLFDVVKRNDRALESGRKEIVKRTQEKGDANSIYQAMTANDSTNAAKRVIRQRIQKGTFDDGSLKKGENPFKMKGFSGFGNKK